MKPKSGLTRACPWYEALVFYKYRAAEFSNLSALNPINFCLYETKEWIVKKALYTLVNLRTIYWRAVITYIIGVFRIQLKNQMWNQPSSFGWRPRTTTTTTPPPPPKLWEFQCFYIYIYIWTVFPDYVVKAKWPELQTKFRTSRAEIIHNLFFGTSLLETGILKAQGIPCFTRPT